MPQISPRLLATVALCIGTGIAAGQSTPPPNSASSTAATTAPVAYVYVSSGQFGSAGHIYGFAAAQNGKLTPVPGSPIAAPGAEPIALNGKWLFGGVDLSGANETGQYAINSYRIAANGSIRLTDTYNGTALYSEEPQNLVLDHTGGSLYADMQYSDEDQGYQSFSIDQTNGKVTPVNYASTDIGAGALTFIGNNRFAYSVSCFRMGASLWGYERESDGGLSAVNVDQVYPPLPSNDWLGCPLAAAADPTNHIVSSMTFYPQVSTDPNTNQLALYTANSDDGNLSTASTPENMPTTKVEPDVLAMSTGGAFLAVAGSVQDVSFDGLQLFRMHGAKPLTAFSGVLIPGVYAKALFWDKKDNLYLLSTSKLYVFNVTQSGVKQAPGSPHSIANADSLIVLYK